LIETIDHWRLIWSEPSLPVHFLFSSFFFLASFQHYSIFLNSFIAIPELLSCLASNVCWIWNVHHHLNSCWYHSSWSISHQFSNSSQHSNRTNGSSSFNSWQCFHLNLLTHCHHKSLHSTQLDRWSHRKREIVVIWCSHQTCILAWWDTGEDM
jgi:hypothetical protein